jgi:hypothetical protein
MFAGAAVTWKVLQNWEICHLHGCWRILQSLASWWQAASTHYHLSLFIGLLSASQYGTCFHQSKWSNLRESRVTATVSFINLSHKSHTTFSVTYWLQYSPAIFSVRGDYNTVNISYWEKNWRPSWRPAPQREFLTAPWVLSYRSLEQY